MKSLFKFVIEPKNGRYNNEKKIGDKNLLLNTELQNHQYVNRNGFVLSKPVNEETDIEVGDEVIVHHNEEQKRIVLAILLKTNIYAL